jgi:hypothetical protein
MPCAVLAVLRRNLKKLSARTLRRITSSVIGRSSHFLQVLQRKDIITVAGEKRQKAKRQDRMIQRGSEKPPNRSAGTGGGKAKNAIYDAWVTASASPVVPDIASIKRGCLSENSIPQALRQK